VNTFVPKNNGCFSKSRDEKRHGIYKLPDIVGRVGRSYDGLSMWLGWERKGILKKFLFQSALDYISFQALEGHEIVT
jgi:hypothetical protein